MTTTDIAPFAPEGNGQPLTMSSREIAELCEKRHGDVIRDIRVMLDALGDDADLRHVAESKDARGYTSEVALPKDLTITLIAGYNVKLRKRIIDRWLELEEGARTPQFILDPSDPKVMLACFDYLQKQVAEKDAIIAVQGEKVKQLDRLAAAEGSMCLRDAAKTLNVRPKDLNAFMSARRWIYKRVGNAGWIAYQDKIQAGLMEHIDHPFFDDQGRERIATRAQVTAKGLVKLAELLEQPLH